MIRRGFMRRGMAVILSISLAAAPSMGAAQAEEILIVEENSGQAEELSYEAEETGDSALEELSYEAEEAGDSALGELSYDAEETGDSALEEFSGGAKETDGAGWEGGIEELILDVEEISGPADGEDSGERGLDLEAENLNGAYLADGEDSGESVLTEEAENPNGADSGDPEAEAASGESGSAADGESLPIGFEDEIVEVVEESADPEMELAAYSGTTGPLSWVFQPGDSGGTLVISGNGAMPDFSLSDPMPWNNFDNQIVSVEIGYGVTHLGDQSFANCYYLRTVSIPDTVTSLGEGMFYGCSFLEEVSLPAGVTKIPRGAFSGCQRLKTISAPGVVTVEEYAFENTGFTQFTVGAATTSIDPLAFFNTNITSFAVEAGNPSFSALDGVLFGDGGATLVAYPAGAAAASYTVPAGVTRIENGAFVRNKCLTQISLGNVTSLGMSAFQECAALKSIVIPDSVEGAGLYTFYGCTELESLKFGSGLTCTALSMFYNCKKLSSIDFGTGLQEVESSAFGGCTALTSVSLPASVTKIAGGAFADCTSLISFSSAALTEIPQQAFLNDTALVSVSLNEGVETINSYAFGGCTALAAVTLPATVTFVHSTAFEATTAVTVMNPKLEHYGVNGYHIVEHVTVSGTRKYGEAYQVLELVNQQRAANGLGALVMNASLLEAAMVRAAETSVLFSHTRPDGSLYNTLTGSPTGENISCLPTTAEGVMYGWMNSTGHRANILEARYTTIGVGCFVIDGTYYWVQVFGCGNDGASCQSPADRDVSEDILISTETFEEAASGYTGSYTFQFKIRIKDEYFSIGDTDQLILCVVNPKTGYATRIDDSGCVFTSSNPSVVSVNGKTASAVSAGTAVISTVTSRGYYTATGEIEVKEPLRFTVDVTEKMVYTGKAVKPRVRVSVDGKYLSSNCYDVTYSNNVNVGIATVTVTGAVSDDPGYVGMYEEYFGQATFRIVPQKAKLVSVKSGKKRQAVVKWKKDSQGSGYEIQYSTGKKFKKKTTLTIKKAKTVKTTLKKLKSKKTYYVRVRTFKNVNGVKLYGAWSKKMKVKVK